MEAKRVQPVLCLWERWMKMRKRSTCVSEPRLRDAHFHARGVLRNGEKSSPRGRGDQQSISAPADKPVRSVTLALALPEGLNIE